jgi:methylated-DNA-[protein]-cysteine S-methyltransferase
MNPTLYFTEVASPLGMITLTATDHGLSGLYFEGQKHWPTDSATWQRDDGPRFDATRAWLASYFSGKGRGAIPKLDVITGTEFQKKVWQALKGIPESQTRTYGQLAEQIGAPNAVRAVGAAIGRNPISLLIPCHRVIGSTGLLTGYAGGVDRKRWLLEHEEAL